MVEGAALAGQRPMEVLVVVPQVSGDIVDRLVPAGGLVALALFLGSHAKDVAALHRDLLGEAVKARRRDWSGSFLRLHVVQLVDRTKESCRLICQLSLGVDSIGFDLALAGHGVSV
jgi:hypothetical protein